MDFLQIATLVFLKALWFHLQLQWFQTRLLWYSHIHLLCWWSQTNSYQIIRAQWKYEHTTSSSSFPVFSTRGLSSKRSMFCGGLRYCKIGPKFSITNELECYKPSSWRSGNITLSGCWNLISKSGSQFFMNPFPIKPKISPLASFILISSCCAVNWFSSVICKKRGLSLKSSILDDTADH